MTKGTLPKAYLRLDPNIDQTHADPGGMVRVMCAANRQPDRGWFKSRSLMEGILGKALVRGAIARGDVKEMPDGRWRVPGWEEWQEGDWTVGERQRRIRARRNDENVTPPLPDRDTTVTSGVTPPVPDRYPPSEALGLKGSKASGQQGVDSSVDDNLRPLAHAAARVDR